MFITIPCCKISFWASWCICYFIILDVFCVYYPFLFFFLDGIEPNEAAKVGSHFMRHGGFLGSGPWGRAGVGTGRTQRGYPCGHWVFKGKGDGKVLWLEWLDARIPARCHHHDWRPLLLDCSALGLGWFHKTSWFFIGTLIKVSSNIPNLIVYIGGSLDDFATTLRSWSLETISRPPLPLPGSFCSVFGVVLRTRWLIWKLA